MYLFNKEGAKFLTLGYGIWIQSYEVFYISSKLKSMQNYKSFFNLSQCIIVNPLRCVRNAAKNVLSSKKSMGSLCENFFRNIDSFSSEKVHYAIIKIN